MTWRMTAEMRALRYSLIVKRAKFAHALICAAKKIMPRGHERGAFVRPSEEMKEALASYGAALSRAQADLKVAHGRLGRIVALHDELLAARHYVASDRVRDALTLDCGHPDMAASVRLYAGRFDVSSRGRPVPFLATPAPKPPCEFITNEVAE